MTNHIRQEQKNLRALAISALLVLLVGGYYIGRTFFSQKNSSSKETAKETAKEQDPESGLPTMTADVIRQKIYNGDAVVFLDTRDKSSFDAEHIPHSLLMSPGTLSAYTPEENQTVVIVYSVTDSQTVDAIENIMKQKSYPSYMLKGGFEEWKRSGNQVLSHGDPNSFLDQSKVTYVTPAEALALINDSAERTFILDTQSEQDFARKHIKGATNIPLDQLERRSKEIPAARTILVYGASDVVSFQAGVRLADLNVFTARTLHGDFSKIDSGLPLEP